MESMENKEDIRLYYFGEGQLYKMGRGKTGIHKHMFNSLKECQDRIVELKKMKMHSLKETQFVIVKYFGVYKSQIVYVS